MVRKFRVGFFYYKDLRWESEVLAHDEVAALVLARNEQFAASNLTWCDRTPGFRIEIVCA